MFNASVYTTDITDSAALGGCYRAIHGKYLSKNTYVPPKKEHICTT